MSVDGVSGARRGEHGHLTRRKRLQAMISTSTKTSWPSLWPPFSCSCVVGNLAFATVRHNYAIYVNRPGFRGGQLV